MRCRNRARTLSFGVAVARNQTLGLAPPRIRAGLLLRVGARIEHAEVPTLLVLNGGGPVRIQQIAFIQTALAMSSISLVFIARPPLPLPDSSRSSASSQVGIPLRTLNSYRRSNTSR